MALPVDVSSIDVLRSVREAFVLFADDARHALGAMESELRRAIDWLTHDQRLYWLGEVKRRTEYLSSAKAELSRKQLGVAPGSSGRTTPSSARPSAWRRGTWKRHRRRSSSSRDGCRSSSGP